MSAALKPEQRAYHLRVPQISSTVVPHSVYQLCHGAGELFIRFSLFQQRLCRLVQVCAAVAQLGIYLREDVIPRDTCVIEHGNNVDETGVDELLLQR